jgi:dihydrofolate reductase
VSRLIVSEFMTLDGVVEAPGGEPTHPHGGWAIEFGSQEQMEYKLREVQDAESLLLGRVTYEGFAAAWPGRDGVFADKMNAMPKYVVSSTLSAPLAWENSALLTGDPAAAVAQLKARETGIILVAGSASLVPILIEHDLVDELRLMVFPLMVGGGKRFFPESMQKKRFEPAGSTAFPSGVAVHTYVPARD